MTNEELENRVRALAGAERKISVELIRLISEAEARDLHLQRAFPNMYEWLCSFGYSHPAAIRRVHASRLAVAVPEILPKLEQGFLNLTVVALVQSVFRREERRVGTVIPAADKAKFLRSVEGKTIDQTQRLLAEAFPDSAPVKDEIRARNAEESVLNIVLKTVAVQALERSRELLAHHFNDGASYANVITKIAIDFVEENDPLRSSADKQRVRIFKRAGGQCEYVDEMTLRRCSARQYLEIDHIIPRAIGGTYEDSNLRLLCHAHNLLEAARILGDYVKSYRPRSHSPP